MYRSILLFAALADFAGVFIHGVLGYRALILPIFDGRLFATTAFGDEDVTRRVLLVGWHLITVLFFCSGVAFVLLSLQPLGGDILPHFLAAVHGGFAVCALAVVGPRLPTVVQKPIPIGFLSVMTTVALVGGLGA